MRKVSSTVALWLDFEKKWMRVEQYSQRNIKTANALRDSEHYSVCSCILALYHNDPYKCNTPSKVTIHQCYLFQPALLFSVYGVPLHLHAISSYWAYKISLSGQAYEVSQSEDSHYSTIQVPNLHIDHAYVSWLARCTYIMLWSDEAMVAGDITVSLLLTSA